MLNNEQRKQFEQRILCHRGYLFRMAMSLTRNKENADDVLQQTLIKAYQKWSGFEYNSTLHCRAWAATILRHEFLNLCRENRYHINISLNLHELDNYLNYKRPLVLGSNRKPDQVLMLR